MVCDKIIIGAGLYGLYCARICAEKGDRVLVLEYDYKPFTRATSINQARIHMGYHYPRSYSTAVKAAGYFERFSKEFSSCINETFEKIYAVSSNFSWTNAEQFEKFCSNANIPCEKVKVAKYFKDDACEGAFLTKEYVFDANVLLEMLMRSISSLPKINLQFESRIKNIERTSSSYLVRMENGETYSSDYVINATYASVNQILEMLDFQPFNIKYELCEIILCKVSENLAGLGLTVMDGPFFSIIPFGKGGGLHSLTSV
ncbi:MAG: FAD-binding oxidoreductase, partial [Clostridia bacterium]|nr:FAD-binding oxidoreductase [Clostridia bacterium]